MKASRQALGSAWTWATIAGVVIMLAVALSIRAPETPPAARKPAQASVGLVDPVVIRGTMLFDLTPLFLPTEFNSSRKDYVTREPGGAFAGFPFKPAFAESDIALHLPEPAAVPESPAEALVGDPPGAPFIGFGRTDMTLEVLAPRAAYVEISEAGSGRRVFSQPVSDAHPPIPAWKPVEFIAAVDSSGLVGPPVLTVHSDAADVDAYFARYISETLRVGQRLAPGFYRICVGP